VPYLEGTYAIQELAKSTCRTCFGFGHSQKKCPTEVKVRGYKLGSPFVKTVLANFNAFANSKWLKTGSMGEHPLKKYFDEYFYFMEDTATDDGKKAYKENEARVNLVIAGLKTVCDVCNGWGHIATDK
jgi:hypothetical protein